MYTNEEELLAAFNKPRELKLKFQETQSEAEYRSETEHERVIIKAMDGSEYESGALEEAQNTARNATKVLAALLFMLIEKRIITKDDATAIVRDGMCL